MVRQINEPVSQVAVEEVEVVIGEDPIEENQPSENLAEDISDEELKEKWGQLVDADVIHELFGYMTLGSLARTFDRLNVVVHVDENGQPNTWGVGEPASADNVGGRKWLRPLV